MFTDIQVPSLLIGGLSTALLYFVLDITGAIHSRWGAKHRVSRGLSMLLADAWCAEALMKDNPGLLLPEQCRRLLYTLPSNPAAWLGMFEEMHSRACIEHPGKVPLFRVTRGT